MATGTATLSTTGLNGRDVLLGDAYEFLARNFAGLTMQQKRPRCRLHDDGKIAKDKLTVCRTILSKLMAHL